MPQEEGAAGSVRSAVMVPSVVARAERVFTLVRTALGPTTTWTKNVKWALAMVPHGAVGLMLVEADYGARAISDVVSSGAVVIAVAGTLTAEQGRLLVRAGASACVELGDAALLRGVARHVGLPLQPLLSLVPAAEHRRPR